MDDNYVSAHIICTREEKRLCLATANKLIDLSQMARCKGLLELEAALSDELYQNPPLIKIGVELIVDGTDPEIVSQIMTNYILASDLPNKDFLDNIIAYYGIRAIQLGYNPSSIVESISSLFGFDFREEFRISIKQEADFYESSKWVKLWSEKIELQEKTDLLNFIPETMFDYSVQRLLKEISFDMLVYAISGSIYSVANLFVRNLSRNNKNLLYDDLSVMHIVDKEAIIHSQLEIIKTIKKLMKSGEIMLVSNFKPNVLEIDHLDNLLKESKYFSRINN